MFNVGGGEILVILLLALLVLGPDKLPEYTRKMGRFMAEFRQMTSGFQDEFKSAMDLGARDAASGTGDALSRSSQGPRLLPTPPPVEEPAPASPAAQDRGADDAAIAASDDAAEAPGPTPPGATGPTLVAPPERSGPELVTPGRPAPTPEAGADGSAGDEGDHGSSTSAA